MRPTARRLLIAVIVLIAVGGVSFALGRISRDEPEDRAVLPAKAADQESDAARIPGLGRAAELPALERTPKETGNTDGSATDTGTDTGTDTSTDTSSSTDTSTDSATDSGGGGGGGGGGGEGDTTRSAGTTDG
jgi:hypothetical protein